MYKKNQKKIVGTQSMYDLLYSEDSLDKNIKIQKSLVSPSIDIISAFNRLEHEEAFKKFTAERIEKVQRRHIAAFVRRVSVLLIHKVEGILLDPSGPELDRVELLEEHYHALGNKKAARASDDKEKIFMELHSVIEQILNNTEVKEMSYEAEGSEEADEDEEEAVHDAPEQAEEVEEDEAEEEEESEDEEFEEEEDAEDEQEAPEESEQSEEDQEVSEEEAEEESAEAQEEVEEAEQSEEEHEPDEEEPEEAEEEDEAEEPEEDGEAAEGELEEGEASEEEEEPEEDQDGFDEEFEENEESEEVPEGSEEDEEASEDENAKEEGVEPSSEFDPEVVQFIMEDISAVMLEASSMASKEALNEAGLSDVGADEFGK